MKEIQAGIIGFGFVGKAVYSSYFNFNHKYIIDPVEDIAEGNYETIMETDAVYVCVPSPSNDDGSCDVSILKEVLSKLKEINYKGVVISKVTAPPDVYRELQEEHDNLVYVPEFLTAANSIRDYLSSSFHVIGGKNRAYVMLARAVLEEVFLDASYFYATIEEASMMKYTINCFLATKVSWMNELKNLCDVMNVDYGVVSKLVSMDKRIGNTHLQVPGPDGQLGFGGACFPKDTAALLSFAKDSGVDLTVMRSAVELNKKIRND
jgi:UDPglucose 6-dehydrogenase